MGRHRKEIRTHFNQSGVLVMKIYLLNPPFVENFVRCGRWQGVTARGGTLDYPKWLAYTTAALEQDGHTVKLRDAVASKFSLGDVLKEIFAFHPEVLVIETNFSSLTNDINVLNEIRQSLKWGTVNIVTGPPTATYPERILDNEPVDIVARFEYDFVVRDLVAGISKGEDLSLVRGIWYKKDNLIVKNPERSFSSQDDLDNLPFIAKVYNDHLNIFDYYLSQSLYPVVQIFSGRGCPFKCSFCSWPENLMGRSIRLRSVENLVSEFKFVTEKLPFVKEIFIEDDTFTLNKERVREFCRSKIGNNLNIRWSCNARADLDFETMKLMKKAGCRLVIVGYESGSEAILKSIHKGVIIKRAKEFTKDAKRAGLLVHGDFIIGLPGETHETAMQTLNYIKEIRPDVLQVAVATPIPGTEFYNYVRDNGYLQVSDMKESIDENGYQRCIISYPQFTHSDIENWVNRILKEYYLSPTYFVTFVQGTLRGGGVEHVKSVMRAGKSFIRYILKY